MAINGKKIYEQPQWNGDKSMVIHAQKPGTSEAISVQNILDLVADLIPNTTGDIVLRPDGVYEDAVDMSLPLDPELYPELAGIYGEKSDGLGVASAVQMPSALTSVTRILRMGDEYLAESLDGKIQYFSTGFSYVFDSGLPRTGDYFFCIYKSKRCFYALVLDGTNVKVMAMAGGAVTDTGIVFAQSAFPSYIASAPLALFVESMAGFDIFMTRGDSFLKKKIDAVSHIATPLVFTDFWVESGAELIISVTGNGDRAFVCGANGAYVNGIFELKVNQNGEIYPELVIQDGSRYSLAANSFQVMAYKVSSSDAFAINLADTTYEAFTSAPVGGVMTSEIIDMEMNDSGVVLCDKGAMISFDSVNFIKYDSEAGVVVNNFATSLDDNSITVEKNSGYVDISFDSVVDLPQISAPNGLKYFIKTR